MDSDTLREFARYLRTKANNGPRDPGLLLAAVDAEIFADNPALFTQTLAVMDDPPTSEEIWHDYYPRVSRLQLWWDRACGR